MFRVQSSEFRVQSSEFRVQSSKFINIVIGSVFIIAAILKLMSIDEFEIYIYSFDIFSFLLTTFVSRIIIISEFILGLFLILKINYKLTWRLAFISLILFTLFLIYVAIFRQDANCHCFGELVELSPLESIIKNLVMIALLILGQRTTDNGQQTQAQSSKLLVLSSTFLVFIISPPDSIYKMIYSTEKEVSTVDLYKSFDEVVKIDFTEEGLVFDSISSFKEKENQLIVIVSSGCKYCRLGLKKLSLMMKNEDLATDNVDIFIWGSPEGIENFRNETMTEDYSYWHIMPNRAIEITYGRFPIFIFLKEKDIIKIGDFRDVDDAFI
ncbi:MAG: DoxX family protein [Bacteroidales bacterium]|nr:DoxX family protein [Bacteroidales bacterium]